MKPPTATNGLRHVALNVNKLEETVKFYTDILGMTVEWQPDPDNVYLSSGQDNLALHRATEEFLTATPQRLDHIGFILANADDVDKWYAFMRARNVPIVKAPRTHRDGARSFYCQDPDRNTVQMIYHPPLAKK